MLGIEDGDITWAVLLSGIVPAVLGAGLTVGAAWLVFRRESRAARQDSLREAVEDLAQRAKSYAAILEAAAMDAPKPSVRDLLDAQFALKHHGMLVRSRSERRDQELVDLVAECESKVRVGDVYPPQRPFVHSHVQPALRLGQIADTWINDPSEVRKDRFRPTVPLG